MTSDPKATPYPPPPRRGAFAPFLSVLTDCPRSVFRILTRGAHPAARWSYDYHVLLHADGSTGSLKCCWSRTARTKTPRWEHRHCLRQRHTKNRLEGSLGPDVRRHDFSAGCKPIVDVLAHVNIISRVLWVPLRRPRNAQARVKPLQK